MTIRLIEQGLASWDLYRALPATVDTKQRGGQPGGDEAALSGLVHNGRAVCPKEVVAELERYQGNDAPALA